MFDQLQATQARYEEISQMLTQPQVVSDNQKYRELMKEYAALGPIVEKYREYAQAKEAAEEARQLLEDWNGISGRWWKTSCGKTGKKRKSPRKN